jgi:glycosyltransferase involved in cell wall biosynthesis
MPAAPLQLEANRCEELNQMLRELPLSSSTTILIHTPGWHATSWDLISRGGGEAPRVLLNGEPVNPQLVECVRDRQRWVIESYWCQAALPERQWLQISWPEGQSNQLLQLQASDALSPWQLLQLLRPDVARSILDPLRSWLFSNGIHECNLLRQHPTLLAALNQPISGTHLPWFHWALRQQRQDLQAAIAPHDAAALLHWLKHHGAAEHQLEPISPEGFLVPDQIKLQSWRERPFGVNLFGYATEALGIGEDLRTVHTALNSAGVPVHVVDIPRHHSDEQLRHQAREQPDELAPYAFNIVCLTAEEHGRVLLELGQAVFQERYTIGYWPWELSRWPQVWQPLLVMADEVWASSTHTHSALQTAVGERLTPTLQLFPLPLERLEPLSEDARSHWRREFDLPGSAPLVICSFDGRSSYARKNPWGAIDAFQQALPSDSEAQLVIKTMHAGLADHHWQQLQARVQADPRLLLIDAVLPREQLLGLYGCCDVLLSLHRAEGYGRVLAEALLLGLDVIATAYSGNTDFCIGPLAHPVSYTLLPVLPDEYPHAAGQVWAEPNQAQASALLKRALALRAADPTRRLSQSQAYQPLFSPEAIGQRYAQRLQQIWSER